MNGYYSDSAHAITLTGPAGHAWRRPQVGALGAMVAHWSRTAHEPSLVSLPTGTGKTAVAMAAPYLMRQPPRRVLVVVPSTALREQTAELFGSQRLLRDLGVLQSDSPSSPSVVALSGRVQDWNALAEHDVTVALPHSISPEYYEEDAPGPPQDLFDLVIVDEAHHAPATTWRAIIDHFAWKRALLLTATPRRRDKKPVPGELIYYYPLRRALDEGLYNPVTPELLDAPVPFDREAADRAVAQRTVELVSEPEHATSTVIVRGLTVDRLRELCEIYRELGIEIEALHNRLGDAMKADILDRLRDGRLKAVAVAGMLGEGFDLPSMRIAAYHDKHKSMPATVQLIGRLARVSEAYPQTSHLVTVKDQDVYPALQGAVRDLYDNEDRDWARVLPTLLDDYIEAEKRRADFVAEFPPDVDSAVDLRSLTPLMRVVVHEIESNDFVEPSANEAFMDTLQTGSPLAGGRVAYAGQDQRGELIVIVTEHRAQPRWSRDLQMASRTFDLHLVSYRPASDGHPALVLVNSSNDGTYRVMAGLLDLSSKSRLLDPEQINIYLEGLERHSISAVGVRTTSGRSGTAYRNYLGSGVDRGLRRVDTAGAALGHVNLQYVGPDGGSASGGAAMEKAKIWLTRYVPLADYDEWIDSVVTGIRATDDGDGGQFLPNVDRGHRLLAWPPEEPLAADMNVELIGRGFEVQHDGDRVPIEQVYLYVAHDPLDELDGRTRTDSLLPVVAITEADAGRELVWSGNLLPNGNVVGDFDVPVHRGVTTHELGELLAQHPATIHFVGGTTTVGGTRYDSRSSYRSFNPRDLLTSDWSGVNLRAESRASAAKKAAEDPEAGISIHERLETWLLDQPEKGERRWILCNDGSGEIADYLVVEEDFSGVVHLGLWHAKYSSESTPGLRIGDLQEVIAQAVRSRRHLNDSDLWLSLGRRFDGEESPRAVLVDGSHPAEELRMRLGREEDVDSRPSWPETTPRVVGTIGVVQPGISKAQMIEAARAGAALSFRHLLAGAVEAAEGASGEFVAVVSD